MHEEIDRVPSLKETAKKARDDVNTIKRHGVLTWIDDPAEPTEDTIARRLVASVFNKNEVSLNVTKFLHKPEKPPETRKGTFVRAELNFKILTAVANLPSVRAYMDTGFNIRIISGIRRGAGKFNLVLASLFSGGATYLKANPRLAIEEQRGNSLSVPDRGLDFSWLEANFYGQDTSALTPHGREFVHRLARMNPEEILKKVIKGIK